MKVSQNDGPTMKYFLKNTKDCPKCQIPIEKDGGCNLVSCTNAACRAMFCYKCLVLLREHKLFSERLFCKNNTRKDEESNIGEETLTSSNAGQFATIKEKYLHQHEKILAVEKKWRENQDIPKKISEVELIKSAVTNLLKCRKTLMNAHVHSYYFKTNNIESNIENNLTKLEKITETFSDSLNSLFSSRTRTDLDLIKLSFEECSEQRLALSNHIDQGNKNNWWMEVQNNEIQDTMEFVASTERWQHLLLTASAVICFSLPFIIILLIFFACISFLM